MREFRILGPLEVEGPDGLVHLGGQKQKAVLALLLLDAGRVVPTDRLVDALWGEDPPRTAATSLQNFVSHLRKVVGPDALLTTPPGYALRVPEEQIDLVRFTRACEEARHLAPAERVALLDGALGLWRGDPLAEFRFESWAQNEIGRLEELRMQAIEERLDAELELGLHDRVVGELEALVADNPLRERLCGQLMLALYRSGRQAEALDRYQRARAALAEGLGIDPGPSLQALFTSILRQETALSPRSPARTESDHLAEVVAPLLAGRLVPVLGTDVAHLAAALAERFGVPDADAGLPGISEYVAVMNGNGPLWDELHALLEVEAQPTSIHRFLASLPPVLRRRGAPHQLVVTTGYDLALEQAFSDAGEEVDVVSYLASGPARGRFCHLAPDGSARVIDMPNTYASELSLDRRTVILKLNGRVDLGPGREWESFVVTEDDYIDYLARESLSDAVPVGLAAKLRRSHFLFLGYTMADWNLRVVLNRLWSDSPLTYRSWAVHEAPSSLEREFWRRRVVEVVEGSLERYVEQLGRRIALEVPA